MLPRFSHARPTTLAGALEQLADGQALIHGGGTDLLGCLRDGALTGDRVVSLGAVEELRGISDGANGELRIGAMTTLNVVTTDPAVRSRYHALADAAAVVASPQLRNQGTIAGNLCQKPRCWYYRGDFHCLRKGGEQCFAYQGESHYHCILGGDMCYIVHPSDTAPALVALGAVARIAGSTGERSLAVERLHVPPSDDPQRETYLEPDEVITEIMLPRPEPGLRSSYRKVRARASWDFALAGVALALVFDGDTVRQANVVLSGVAPVPWRAAAAEQELTGHPLTADAISRAAEAAVADADPLAHNAYKVPLVKGLLTDQMEAMRSASG